MKTSEKPFYCAAFVTNQAHELAIGVKMILHLDSSVAAIKVEHL